MENHPSVPVSKTAVLIVASLSAYLTPFLFASVAIALPTIGKELNLTAVELNWVTTVYLLVAALFLVPFGRIADIVGRKKIFAIGIIINIVASILCTFATSVTGLIIFRALQGIGAGLIFGTSIAILTSVFPAKERGRALGITTAATYIGLSTGPLLGGLLTSLLGWRSIFFFNALIGIIALLILLWKIKGEWADARGEKLDYVGSIIFALALLALMGGFSLLPDLTGAWLILVGLIAIGVFFKWESTQKFPVLNVGLFKNNRVFAFSNLAALVNYLATSGVTFLLSLYLQYIKGLSAEYAGLILIAQPVLMVICSPISGILSDKVEPRILSTIGMTLTTTGLTMLIFINSGTGLAYIIVSLVILGTGFGFFTAPNTNAVMGSIERKYYGIASGILGTMRLLGQTLSLGIVLLLFALLIGRVQITADSYPLFLNSLKIAFIISAILSFAGIFASAVRGKSHADQGVHS